MKVAVVGLDCADPELVFDELLDEMPNLAELVEQGAHGPIRSTDPPETVPAWMSFATSKNPGRLGFTGFRNRAWRQTSTGRMGNYGEGFIASSLHVDEPTLWDIVGDADKEVVLVGVPQTFPVEPVNGALVAGLLAPSTDAPYTHPPDLADEIEAEIGDYLVDVPDPEADPAQVVADAKRMTDQRFALSEHLAATRSWDLLFMVAMGPDRVHHAAWSTHDHEHPLHEPGREDLLADYYRHLDERIGEFVDALPDDTAILVVSDHGAKAGQGVFCLNDWLRQEGYLVLEEDPEDTRGFDPKLVDWSQTRAWARAGYAGRVHVNVEGREPEGVVEPTDYEEVRDEIRTKLEAMSLDGHALGTRVLKPREVHQGPHVDEGPDLLCYVGDLAYRCDERLGNGGLRREPEPGRDEAVHDYHGLFVLSDPAGRYGGRIEDMELVDGAPTVLELLGLPVPSDMEGRVLQPDGSLAPP